MNLIRRSLYALSLLCSLCVSAEEKEPSSMYYFKLGGATVPTENPIPLPRIGLGARFYRENRALDFALNFSSILFVNDLSFKGLYLHYPYPERNYRWYYGGGLGLGYHATIIPMGGPFGCGSSEGGYLSAEGVVGYEFNHHKTWKTFVQLELTQPIVQMGGRWIDRHAFPTPGIGIVGGIGF